VSNIPAGEYGRNTLSISRALSKLPGIRAGQTVFITNALPYIPALERGHSTQASQGMIGVTIRELKRWVPGAVRQLRQGRDPTRG